MSLEFADFASCYATTGMTEEQQLAHFEVLAQLLEALVQCFWQDGGVANSLGISFENDTFAITRPVESDVPLLSTFEYVACEEVAGKDSR